MIVSMLASLMAPATAAQPTLDEVIEEIGVQHRAPVRSTRTRSSSSARSTSRPTSRPASRSSSRPTSRPTSRSSSRPTSRPAARPASRPTSRPPARRPAPRTASRTPARRPAPRGHRPPSRPVRVVRPAPPVVVVHAPPPRPRQARAATPVRDLRTRPVDRTQSLAIGISAGAYLHADVDGGSYADPGLGLSARYRPVPVFGIELAGAHHLGLDNHSQAAVSGQLFLFPNQRFSPYGLAGVTGTLRTPGLGQSGDVDTLGGLHVGGGAEIAIGQRIALDIEGRFISTVAPDPTDRAIPGAAISIGAAATASREEPVVGVSWWYAMSVGPVLVPSLPGPSPCTAHRQPQTDDQQDGDQQCCHQNGQQFVASPLLWGDLTHQVPGRVTQPGAEHRVDDPRRDEVGDDREKDDD